MIAMNGEPDKWTNLMYAFNTFLNFFWSDYFSGANWAQDPFLEADVQKAQQEFIKMVNRPEDEMSIGVLTYIQGIKPSPHWTRGRHPYPTPLMTYYENDDDKYGDHPQVIFGKIMDFLKVDSVQEVARQSFKEAGLPYMIINNTGD